MKFASLIVAVLVLLSGCSSQTIEPSYYLLRSNQDMETRALTPSTDFALGNVIIAPYVDQQNLLLETQAGEMRPARHHLWAEPMYEGVRSFLAQEISRAKGKDILPTKFVRDATIVDIRLDQLHGTHDGQAKLVAYWWLHRDGKISASFQFAKSKALSQDGYAALADAEKALLAELAQEIAVTLVTGG